MAKRKRLSPALLTSERATSPGSQRPPIAHVASAAAEAAAFSDLAQALSEARAEGRLIQKLPLAEIEIGHLVRDRVAFDEAEMAALRSSLEARGQQVPIEVVALDAGGYGLISGLRRVMALRDLGVEQVLALVRKPDNSAQAYQAMVEENEIRAGISFYERARLGAEAARLGIYESPQAAIATLFAAASAAKRSKIGSFVRIHDELGDVLRFPAAIPERLGLALVAAFEAQGFVPALRAALLDGSAPDAAAERALLEQALKTAAAKTPPQRPPEIVAGITVEARAGRVVLRGAGVTETLLAELRDWLSAR